MKSLPLRYRFRIRKGSDDKGWMRMFLMGLIGFQITRNYFRPNHLKDRYSSFSIFIIPFHHQPGQSLNSFFHWEKST